MGINQASVTKIEIKPVANNFVHLCGAPNCQKVTTTSGITAGALCCRTPPINPRRIPMTIVWLQLAGLWIVRQQSRAITAMRNASTT